MAETMLASELPQIVAAALLDDGLDLPGLDAHIECAEDAEHLRAQLQPRGLVAFLADGSVLPRASGVDPRPLDPARAVPFRSPPELRVSLELPHRGEVTGMGIPKGVSLIVGGGYHGKTTLLRAIELGIYNHVPGDGRELCVAVPTAVKVRASSGRSVVGTDISSFIDRLPGGIDTRSFTTPNASGSTSQAASIMESIEAGAELLLMDEDTSAANFMVRDGRMQRLVAHDDEPITAFVDRVRPLYEQLGVSTILVMGGSGDYLDVVDRVIQMNRYLPHDVTARARAIVEDTPADRTSEAKSDLRRPEGRALDGSGLDPTNQYGHRRIAAPSRKRLLFGQLEIDLDDLEQLVEPAQTRAIGRAIDVARRRLDGSTPLRAVLDEVMSTVEGGGLDALDPRRRGDLAAFRALDLAGALNRARDLQAPPAGPEHS